MRFHSIRCFIALCMCTIFGSSCDYDIFSGKGKVFTEGADNISYFSASVSGRVKLPSETSTNLSFGILYSTSEGILLGSSERIDAKEFDGEYRFSILLSSLISGTRYYYRAFLIQDSDIVYGEVKSFTTLSSGFENFVDLGLSVKWATCNLGADSPEKYGRYFAWGDIVGQIWNGSSWSGAGFSTDSSYQLDANNNLKPEYDAAHVLLGGSWRMPTYAEFEELINNCNCTWISNYNGTGVAGRIFTSKKAGYTDKSIFLPAAGYGGDSGLHYAGSNGYYWSSTFRSDDTAWYLYFYSDGVFTYNYGRSRGRSVRPVTE